MRTSELIGPALDWAVARCEDVVFDEIERSKGGHVYLWLEREYPDDCRPLYQPSTDWSLAGPIIEREDIVILGPSDDWGTDERGYCNNQRIKVWAAVIEPGRQQAWTFLESESPVYSYDTEEVITGPTPLIAAMRCYIASKLGDDIDIPAELMP